MIFFLALSAVGTWNYAGFLADPTPAPPPSAMPEPTPPTASAVVEPRPEEAPKAKPPAAPKVQASTPQRKDIPRPTLYRSTDALGQTWEHPDAAFLASFVEARNRSLVSFRYVPTMPLATSSCASGRCIRP